MGGRLMARGSAGVAAAVVALALAAPALGAFPGQNGKIAFHTHPFSGPLQAWTVDPDGSDLAPLGGTCEQYQALPRWSPGGSKLLYVCDGAVWVVNADGSGHQWVRDDGPPSALAWSPDGQQFVLAVGNLGDEDYIFDTYVVPAPGYSTFGAYLSNRQQDDLDWSPDGWSIVLNFADDGDLWTIRPDATAPTNLTNTAGVAEGSPSWAPDNSKLAFVKKDGAGWSQIYAIESDGSGVEQLTSGAANKGEPAWSPDGRKIAFTAKLDGQAANDVYTMNADGTGVVRLTSTPENDESPDWQPIPVNGYPRPKGTYPLELSLVPAYRPCTAPNRTHGPPLAFPSCAPPQRSPGQLTVGTADSNGKPTKSVSIIRMRQLVGNPQTPADEADIQLSGTVNDVRLASDLSDYTGTLEARMSLRITDKDNTPHPGGPGAATVQDITYSFPIPCAATPDTTIGADCTFDTTAEAFVPGIAKELRRSIWELGALRVHDGAGNLFLTQGIFVP